MTNIEILKEAQAKTISNTDIADPVGKQLADYDLISGITELIINYRRSLDQCTKSF